MCIRTKRALTGSGNLWMPNQLLCPQHSRNIQTPSGNIPSNCLTWFCQNELAVSQPRWKQQWRSEPTIHFVLLVYLPERKMCVFEITTPTASVFSCNVENETTALLEIFSEPDAWLFLSNCLQSVISCLDSSVWVLGYGLNDPGFESRRMATFLSSPCRPNRLWGPSRILFGGCRKASPGTQRPEGDVDHSPPNATFNNVWCITSVPIWRVGMERNNVTFAFL